MKPPPGSCSFPLRICHPKEVEHGQVAVEAGSLQVLGNEVEEGRVKAIPVPKATTALIVLVLVDERKSRQD